MCNISRPPSNCVEFSQNPKFISTMASPEDSVELLMLKMIVVNGWKVKNSSGGKKEATQASGARGLWSKAVYKVEITTTTITTNISIIFINITDKSFSPSQILTKAVHKVGEGLRLRCSTTMQWMESSNKVFPESDLEELAEKENALEDAPRPQSASQNSQLLCHLSCRLTNLCKCIYMSCAHIYKTIHDLSLKEVECAFCIYSLSTRPKSTCLVPPILTHFLTFFYVIGNIFLFFSNSA